MVLGEDPEPVPLFPCTWKN